MANSNTYPKLSLNSNSVVSKVQNTSSIIAKTPAVDQQVSHALQDVTYVSRLNGPLFFLRIPIFSNLWTVPLALVGLVRLLFSDIHPYSMAHSHLLMPKTPRTPIEALEPMTYESLVPLSRHSGLEVVSRISPLRIRIAKIPLILASLPHTKTSTLLFDYF
jgi:hypothetical protein